MEREIKGLITVLFVTIAKTTVDFTSLSHTHTDTRTQTPHSLFHTRSENNATKSVAVMEVEMNGV